jgi:hypothetical protein
MFIDVHVLNILASWKLSFKGSFGLHLHLLIIFATMFIGDIGLKISFLLYLFGNRIMLVSMNASIWKAPFTFNL